MYVCMYIDEECEIINSIVSGIRAAQTRDRGGLEQIQAEPFDMRFKPPVHVG